MRAVFVYAAYENLGVEYLSAVAQQAGHETALVFDPSLFDDQFTTAPFAARVFDISQKVVDAVVAAEPDIVCFSLVTDKYPWFVDRAQRIRERIDVPVVAGGIHVTSVPEIVLAHDFCDYVVTGEGEGAFVELLDTLEAGGDVTQIENLGFKRDGGEQVHNPKRRLIDPLDELPFADKEIYAGTSVDHSHMYTIMASRGCPLKCTFCNNNIYHREYTKQSWSRTRSLDSVFAELNQAVERYQPQTINFLDEIFGLSDQWAEGFCERYEREIKRPFIACLYPGFLAEHRIKQLSAAGCVKVDIGVQSVNEDVRKNIMQRRDSNEHIANGIRALKKHGISVAAENIVSTPGETEEHLLEMARFYNDLRPDVMKFFWLKYYPKTEIVDVAQEVGQITPEKAAELHKGIDQNSLSTGGSLPSQNAQKFYTLFVLLPFLSPRVVDVILDKKLYRFMPKMWFPRFSYLILRVLNRKKGSKAEVLMERYKRHYRRYIKERVVAWLTPWRSAPALQQAIPAPAP